MTSSSHFTTLRYHGFLHALKRFAASAVIALFGGSALAEECECGTCPDGQLPTPAEVSLSVHVVGYDDEGQVCGSFSFSGKAPTCSPPCDGAGALGSITVDMDGECGDLRTECWNISGTGSGVDVGSGSIDVCPEDDCFPGATWDPPEPAYKGGFTVSFDETTQEWTWSAGRNSIPYQTGSGCYVNYYGSLDGDCTGGTWTYGGGSPQPVNIPGGSSYGGSVHVTVTISLTGGGCQPVPDGTETLCGSTDDGGGDACGDSDENPLVNQSGHAVAYLTGHKIEGGSDLTVPLPGRDFELYREYSSNPSMFPGSNGAYLWRGIVSDVVPGHVGVNWTTNAFRYLVGDHERGSTALHLGGVPLRTIRSFELVDDASGVRFVPRSASQQYIFPVDDVDFPAGLGSDRSVYRLREPGGVEIDFVRSPNAPTSSADDTLDIHDIAGLPIFERDAYGNTWWYEYEVLVTGTSGRSDPVVLKAIHLNWSPGSLLNDTSDDTWAARVEFLWNGQSGTSYSSVTQWDDTNSNTVWDSGEPANHHFGRLAEVRVVRPDGSSTLTTHTVRYLYFEDIQDTVNPEDSQATLGESYDASEGDLCQVVQSTMVDADAGNAGNPWYERVWQYRYFTPSTPAYTLDGIAFYGQPHQLLAVFYPEQIEFFADHFAQEAIDASILSAPFDSATEAADYLRWISFLDVPGQSFGPLGANWEDYFLPNDYWYSLYDLAGKVISYYGSSHGYRVKSQVVNAGDGSAGSGCGCGGAGGAGGFRLGKRFDYLYKRFEWETLPDGVPSSDPLFGDPASDGYSCQVVESAAALNLSTGVLSYVPYRVHSHDYVWISDLAVGNVGSIGNSSVAWKVASSISEADPNWNYSESSNPIKAADQMAGTGRRWVTLYEYSPDTVQPATGETFTAFHKVAKTITPSANAWHEYVPAIGVSSSTTPPTLPSSTADGLVLEYAYSDGWRTSTSYRRGNSTAVVTPSVATLAAARPDLRSTLQRDPGNGPLENTTVSYGYHNSSVSSTDPNGLIVAWEKRTVDAETEAQNGPASPTIYSTFKLFDTLGQLRWEQAADGRLTYYEYDGLTGMLTKEIRDADPSSAGTGASLSMDFDLSSSGFTAPSGPFEELTTEFGYDKLGRRIWSAGPSGEAHHTRYEVRRTDNVEIDGGLNERGVPFLSIVSLPYKLSNGTFDGPARVSWVDAAGRSIRESSYSVNGSATYAPSSGTYTLLEEVARSDAERMVSGLPLRTRQWHDIGNDTDDGIHKPHANLGSYVTMYEYDTLGRNSAVIDPENGLTFYTAFDIMDRPLVLQQGVRTWSSGSSTDSYVPVAAYWFDGAQTNVQGVGPGNLTYEERYTGESSGGTRITKRWYDYRNRLVGVLNPLAPHQTMAYDDLSRVVESATFTSPSGFSGGSVPAASSNSARSTYTQTLYNNRGMVYRTRVLMDPTAAPPTPPAEDTRPYLESNRWYDADGNVIASWEPNGPATKTVYDSLDRPSVVYVTDRKGDAKPGASGNYADASSVSDDRVIEQTEYAYVADDDVDDKGAGAVELVTHRMRLHSLTPPNDEGALTGSTSVATFTLYEFDDASRVIKNHHYGSNDTTFTSGTSAPSRPSEPSGSIDPGALVSEVGFDAWGRAVEQVSPGGNRTLAVLDAMSRQIAVIEAQSEIDADDITWGSSGNWSVAFPSPVKSDRDRVTTFVYDGLSNVVLRTAHLTGSSSQTTEYVYGVTVGSQSAATSSLIASPGLLWKVHYPNESTGAPDSDPTYTVTRGYNRLGELRGMTDQNATTHSYTRDALGRVISDAAAITNSDLDATITEIATVYDDHGRTDTVTSKSGSTAKNGVKFEYTLLHQVSSVYQDHAGAATTSSPSIRYTYADEGPNGTDGGNYSRISGVDYPTDVENTNSTMAYSYGGTGSLNDRISRLASMDVTGWDGSDPTVVEYEYLGLSMPIKVHHPVPEFGLDYTKASNGTNGASTGTYPALDQYGRVSWHAWVSDGFTTGNSGLPDRTPLIARMYSYDNDSNRTRDWDARPGAVPNNRDWAYSYDPLDRLAFAFRGRHTPGGGTTSNETFPNEFLDDFAVQPGSEKWSLDILGNWATWYKDDDTADPIVWANIAERENRTHNMANELLSRSSPGPGGSTSVIAEPSYDANGNIKNNWPVSTAQNALKYTHDAWNRLVRITKTANSTVILENDYNGLNWRIGRRMDLSQGAYDGIDEERYYFFTPSWQMIEEWVDDDLQGEPTLEDRIDYRAQQFWGVRYIDDAVARRLDRDNDGAWTTQASDNWYYLTDVMFSVRGITDNDGQIHTRVDYTPYGVAMHRYAADVDGNGLINSNDITVYSVNANVSPPLQPGDTNYDPDTDLNGDGFAAGSTAEQATFFNQRWSPYSTGGGNPTVNAGWIDNPIDPNGPDNSVGYDGYWFDLAGAADATSTGLYMVRHRVYDPGTGRWVEKDPAGYIDGMNLYRYAGSSPTMALDTFGLDSYEPKLVYSSVRSPDRPPYPPLVPALEAFTVRNVTSWKAITLRHGNQGGYGSRDHAQLEILSQGLVGDNYLEVTTSNIVHFKTELSGPNGSSWGDIRTREFGSVQNWLKVHCIGPLASIASESGGPYSDSNSAGYLVSNLFQSRHHWSVGQDWVYMPNGPQLTVAVRHGGTYSYKWSMDFTIAGGKLGVPIPLAISGGAGFAVNGSVGVFTWECIPCGK